MEVKYLHPFYASFGNVVLFDHFIQNLVFWDYVTESDRLSLEIKSSEIFSKRAKDLKGIPM